MLCYAMLCYAILSYPIHSCVTPLLPPPTISPLNPPHPHHRPKRLLPPLLLPLPPPRIAQPPLLGPNLSLILDPHKNRHLQHIVVVIQRVCPLIQKPRHNLHRHTRPVAAPVPHLAGLDLRRAVGEEGAPLGRGEGGQRVVPDVGVGADLEVGAEDGDAGLDFARGGAGGGEGDFYGVEEGVCQVEEEVGGDAWLEGVVVDGCRGCATWCGERGVGVERADGEARDVVQSQELDLVAGGCYLGLGLGQDLAAGAAAFGALGAEEGGQGTQFVGEADVGVDLGVLLGRGEGDAPAVFLDALDCLGVLGGVVQCEALERGGSLPHGGWFGTLLLLGARGGVEVHDAGVRRGRGEVDVVGGEGRGRRVGLDLGLVEGGQVGEDVVVVGRRAVRGCLVVGGPLASACIQLLSALALLVSLLVGGQRLPAVPNAGQLGADALALFELDADLHAAPLAVLALEDERGASLAGRVQRVRVHGRGAQRTAEAAPVASVPVALNHGAGHLEQT